MFLCHGTYGKSDAGVLLLYDITIVKSGSTAAVTGVQASSMTIVNGTITNVTDTVTQLI